MSFPGPVKRGKTKNLITAAAEGAGIKEYDGYSSDSISPNTKKIKQGKCLISFLKSIYLTRIIKPSIKWLNLLVSKYSIFIDRLIVFVGSKNKQASPPTLEDNIAASLPNRNITLNDDNPFKVCNFHYFTS